MSAEIAGLPQWVWDLVRAIERYEEEHPPLYRMGDYKDGVLQYDRAQCIEAAGVLKIIPADVRDKARVLSEYLSFAALPTNEGDKS